MMRVPLTRPVIDDLDVQSVSEALRTGWLTQGPRTHEFETLVAAVTAKVRANEPGNVLYLLTKSRVDDNTYRFLELYKDQEAFTRHGQTEYYKDMMSKAGSLVAAAPNVEIFDAVG